MKIKCLKIENHEIFGNITFDFTNSNGSIYDTIILVGENGCGKTTLLNFLSSIFVVKNLSDDVNRRCNFEVDLFLSDNEIKQFNENIIIKQPQDYHIQLSNNDLKITYTQNDLGNSNTRYEIADIPEGLRGVLLSYLKQEFITVYNQVQINLKSKDTNTISSLTIDSRLTDILISDESLANNIKQLFIDIKYQDAEDLQEWVDNNPGRVPPDEIKNKRIKRFNNAFRKIFNDKLYLNNVSTNNNTKNVLFKNNGINVRIDDLSSGEKQIVYRGAFMLKDKNSLKGAIAIIDEPELSMHPKWQLNVLEYYRNLFIDENNIQTSQLFIASHSEYLINQHNTNDLILILTRNNQGKIEVKKYEEKNIIPYCSCAENRYKAFNIPNIEFFNELYGYIYERAGNVETFISSNNINLPIEFQKYTQLCNWKNSKDGKTYQYTPITYMRHEIHHPENRQNPVIHDNIEFLKGAIDFLIYLIKTTGI